LNLDKSRHAWWFLHGALKETAKQGGDLELSHISNPTRAIPSDFSLFFKYLQE